MRSCVAIPTGDVTWLHLKFLLWRSKGAKQEAIRGARVIVLTVRHLPKCMVDSVLPYDPPSTAGSDPACSQE